MGVLATYHGSLCLVAQSCPTLCNPMDYSPPGSSVQGDSPGKNTGMGCHALLQASSQPRDRTQVSHLVGEFFTVWVTREAQHEPLEAPKAQTMWLRGTYCLRWEHSDSWSCKQAGPRIPQARMRPAPLHAHPGSIAPVICCDIFCSILSFSFQHLLQNCY